MTIPINPLGPWFNRDLLRRTAEMLRTHPKGYDQSLWGQVATGEAVDQETLVDLNTPDQYQCGFTACIAGHMVVLAGWKLLFRFDDSYSGVCVNSVGKERPIHEVAGNLLVGPPPYFDDSNRALFAIRLFYPRWGTAKFEVEGAEGIADLLDEIADAPTLTDALEMVDRWV